jgi:hypothetical protein
MSITEQQQTIGREVFRLHQLSAEAELTYELSAGESTAEAELLEKWLAESSEDTLHALLAFRAELVGREAAIEQEQERLAEVKRRNAAKQEWAKARLLDVMKHLDAKSKDVGTFSITVVPGQERAEQQGEVDVETLELLDAAFVKTTEPERKPVKAAILRALKAGREVPGYVLVRGSESVRIK